MSIRFTSPSLGPAHGDARPGAIGTVRAVLLPIMPQKVSPGYTRFVRILKVLLPALAVTLVAIVVLWPQLMKEDDRFHVGIADVDVGPDDGPSMINVRYLGTDSRQQPYVITADLARNVDSDGARVALAAPKADILLADGTWLIMSASEGLYERKGQTLELSGEVNLFHDSGYEFRTDHAVIDLDAGQARGERPVRGQGPFGDLSAEGFRITDQGKTLVFPGPARAIFYPLQDEGKAP